MNRYRCILLTLLSLLLLTACSSKRSVGTGGLFPIVMRPAQWGYIDKSGTWMASMPDLSQTFLRGTSVV